MIRAGLFNHTFRYASKVDIGVKRSTNQDELICCPEYGFFGISDGMGGLLGGGDTSAMIAKVLPGLIGQAYKELKKNPQPTLAAELLGQQIRLLSDSIYEKLNHTGRITFGATLCGVWLLGEHAVFINLGDSRGYLLGHYKKNIRQVTRDHNITAELVANGELSRKDAQRHPLSSSLTRFVGMANPALPETFIERLNAGDRILLCSDGLHGMVEDKVLPRLLRSSRNPERVTERLSREANLAGGQDNISVVYISVYGEVSDNN